MSGSPAPEDVRVVDATDWAEAAWDAIAARSPRGEAFQSHAWGELKRGLGWEPRRYVVEAGGERVAAVFVQERPAARRLPSAAGRLTILYAPRGPILLRDGRDAAALALTGLRRIARVRHAIALTIDPAWTVESVEAEELARAGFRPAVREIQVSRTAMVVPLHANEAAQHAELSDSTARNVNKARRLGTTAERIDLSDPVTRDAALDVFYDMHLATGHREGFLVRDRAYELDQWRRLSASGLASLWFAVAGERRRTGVLLLHCGRLLVSFAAGSPDDADLRGTRANHLLQWEILRWAAGAGFEGYDLGGVDNQAHPGFPSDESHPLWNLYQFKKGFGGREELRVAAHEFTPRPLLGSAWRLARRWR